MSKCFHHIRYTTGYAGSSGVKFSVKTRTEANEPTRGSVGAQDAATHRPPTQSELDGVQVGDGTPHLGDQTLLRHVDVAEVEGVVDGLHLPHFDEPHPDRLGCSLQDPLPVVLGLVQDLFGKQTSREGGLG